MAELPVAQQQSEQNTGQTDPQSRHPVNLRISLPFFRRRYFLAVIAGSEKRSLERRTNDRQIHPIKTASNVLFIAGFAVFFYAAAFIAIAIQSSIVEF